MELPLVSDSIQYGTLTVTNNGLTLFSYMSVLLVDFGWKTLTAFSVTSLDPPQNG